MTFSSRKNITGLYALTDARLSGLSDTDTTRILLEAGVRIIQLRNKILDPLAYYEEAVRVCDLCRACGAQIIVNDRLDVALAVGADGVHLGQDDLELSWARHAADGRLMIGISTHSVDQAVRAEDGGADYIGFGPMFRTDTKDAGQPRGLAMLSEVCRRVSIPVVGIGGITYENARAVMDAGADAVAVASGILAGDIRAQVRRFVRVLENRMID